MFEVGRVCLKIAGRDANKFCAVVEVVDDKFVVVDGQTRRKKVNTLHLEPITKKVDIQSGASTQEVCQALTSAGMPCKQREQKEKKEKAPRPKRMKKKKASTAPQNIKKDEAKKTPEAKPQE